MSIVRRLIKEEGDPPSVSVRGADAFSTQGPMTNTCLLRLELMDADFIEKIPHTFELLDGFKKIKKVIIAGCRDIEGERARGLVIDAFTESGFYDADEIVHGGARGIDSAAGELFAPIGMKVTEFRADWRAHGKAAGPIRNREMAEYADALIAIWDGVSRGTKNMIETAEKEGLKVYVKMVDGEGGER